MRSIIAVSLLLVYFASARAEIVQYGGSADALPHDSYIHVVSEAVSPVQQTYVKAKDGVYIAAALRKPKGEGPFPAILVFHGAPGGRGMEQLVGWSRGDHGGPLWERFLQEGFVVVVADYRGGDLNTMNAPSSSGLVTAVDDGLAIIEHVKGLPYVDGSKLSVYGVSLGGNLAVYLASKAPSLHAVVLGAPAPVWFLGHTLPASGPRPDFAKLPLDAETARANIAPIRTPILIQVGTNDRLLPLDVVLHDQLAAHGKAVRMEVYEHGYHDFVLGPQGQKRSDMPQGEFLMQGALDALERAVAFVKSPPKSNPDD
jgi:dienelactone hydrolase